MLARLVLLGLAARSVGLRVGPEARRSAPAKETVGRASADAVLTRRAALTSAVGLSASRIRSKEQASLLLPVSAVALSAREKSMAQTTGNVFGTEEDAPFRSALSQISQLLDKLGVEGAVQRTVEPPPGPPIERPYVVGLKAGTDRLRSCEDALNAPADVRKQQPKAVGCVSSTRLETPAHVVAPFVYFDQKGDAVGKLIETLYSARDAQLLTAKGNFFNGAGVYVLAELNDVPPPVTGSKAPQQQETLHDVEFQFLPGVLENIVDVRIVAREGRATEARQRYLLGQLGEALGWVPLQTDAATLTKDQRLILESSLIEMDFRNKFEGEMEKADEEMQKQMALESKRIEELKQEVKSLLESISRQEQVRMDDFASLRSRTAETRAQYEAGVNKRIGGVANNGVYGPGQSIRLGNSFAGLINSNDDVMSKVYQNAGGDRK